MHLDMCLIYFWKRLRFLPSYFGKNPLGIGFSFSTHFIFFSNKFQFDLACPLIIFSRSYLKMNTSQNNFTGFYKNFDTHENILNPYFDYFNCFKLFNMFLNQMDNLLIYFDLFVNFWTCVLIISTHFFQHVPVENGQPFVHYGTS